MDEWQHQRVTSAEDDAVLALYERCPACCNEHRCEQLGEFVSEDVSGSGPVDGGIAATGQEVETQELVVHRVAGGTIVSCWGDLLPVVRDALRS